MAGIPGRMTGLPVTGRKGAFCTSIRAASRRVRDAEAAFLPAMGLD